MSTFDINASNRGAAQERAASAIRGAEWVLGAGRGRVPSLRYLASVGRFEPLAQTVVSTQVVSEA